MAGYEGRDEVLSPVEGLVIAVKPEDGWLAVEDDRGIVVDCGHMDSIRPEIREGGRVVRGQPVGLVGRKGPSGNYSHLHLGLYLRRADFEADRPCRNLNLTPWIVEAYRAATGTTLLAVARPHLTAPTGEKIVFDGRNSVAYGGRIVSYRWEFSDGSSASGPVAEKAFDRPGVHTAVLRIEDDRGGRDADVCRARIYTAGRPEDMLATLFFTASPTGGLKAGRVVHFRGWPQGGDAGRIRLDFGDGSPSLDYEAFTDAAHRFGKPGLYIVTAHAEKDGRTATEKLKIVVSD